MARILAACAVLAALAVPASALPSAPDDIVEARASSAGKAGAKSALKCRYVNGVLTCTF